MVSLLNPKVTTLVPSTTKADVVAAYRREGILEAARSRFLAAGLKGTTISQIASTAGVAKGTVYLYYPSKDAILQHILRQDLSKLRQATVPAIDADGPIDDRVRAYLRAMLAFYEDRRDFIDLCQTELGTDLRQEARRQLGDVFSAQEKAWARALSGAGARKADAGRTARGIVSLAYGLALRRIRGWLTGPADDDVEAAVRLIRKGTESG